MGTTDNPDPFAIFHTPPPNETAGERVAREEREAAARKVSDRIDEELKQEKARLKRQKVIRVLLLGQSESGKSTTLKNFRYQYARAEWDAERSAWRAVIQLNVVRSVMSVLDAVQAQLDGVHAGAEDGAPTPTVQTFSGGPDGSETASSPKVGHMSMASALGSPTIQTAHRTSSFKHPLASPGRMTPTFGKGFTSHQSGALLETYITLRDRLECLNAVEIELMRRLGEGGTEDYGSESGSLLGVLGKDDEGLIETSEDEPRGRDMRIQGRNASRSRTPGGGGSRVRREWGVHHLHEALVRSASSRSLKGKAPVRNGSVNNGSNSQDGAPRSSEDEEEDEPTHILAECREAMQSLWADEGVRAVLKRRKVRVEDRAGFFLDDLARIARLDYTPSDADVVRARLRTLGVQEYKLKFNAPTVAFGGIGSDFQQDWVLYDVGGSRTIRHAWVPYFDNIQAIIFLAPVSCFDERLTEDSKVNRLEDSFLLFRKICASKLLARATIILFLNKVDLLKRKLRAGVKVREYLPSFGERKNEPAVVVKYLREKFREVLKENSPEQRSSYFYATSVIDTSATANTITAVKDSIVQNYLKRADFL